MSDADDGDEIDVAAVRAQIEAQLASIEAEAVFGYEPANVYVNAPQALIQTELNATHDALEWVLTLLEEADGGDA